MFSDNNMIGKDKHIIMKKHKSNIIIVDGVVTYEKVMAKVICS